MTMIADAPPVLDPATFPNLTGPEARFYEFWWQNIRRPGDPQVMRWLEYEEGSVERARQRFAELERVVALEGAKVLEVGCQAGSALVALDQLGADPVGIDVDAKTVAGAQLRAEGYQAKLRAEVGTASEMSFSTGEFDIVVSFDVLEHVPDKLAMLHEIVRVLRPGGVLMLSAPNRFGLKHLAADPHYNRKGITPLPGSVARWWVTKVLGQIEYGVETLPTRSWTERQLIRRGMQLLPAPGESLPPRGFRGLPQRFTNELRQGFTIFGCKSDGGT